MFLGICGASVVEEEDREVLGIESRMYAAEWQANTGDGRKPLVHDAARAPAGRAPGHFSPCDSCDVLVLKEEDEDEIVMTHDLLPVSI